MSWVLKGSEEIPLTILISIRGIDTASTERAVPAEVIMKSRHLGTRIHALTRTWMVCGHV